MRTQVHGPLVVVDSLSADPGVLRHLARRRQDAGWLRLPGGMRTLSQRQCTQPVRAQPVRAQGACGCRKVRPR